MTARDYYHPKAGSWVAYRDVDRTHARTGEPVTSREYPWSNTHAWHSYTTRKSEGLRFDTKAEAMTFIRTWSPRRVRGVRLGAERVER